MLNELWFGMNLECIWGYVLVASLFICPFVNEIRNGACPKLQFILLFMLSGTIIYIEGSWGADRVIVVLGQNVFSVLRSFQIRLLFKVFDPGPLVETLVTWISSSVSVLFQINVRLLIFYIILVIIYF